MPQASPPRSSPTLTTDEIQRYSRHLILPEVGLEGQRALKRARVLLVGAGGLGSPAGLYLAAAGVGRLGIVDGDRVDASNLQRQVLHGTADLGRSKVDSALARLADINPAVELVGHRQRLDRGNVLELLAGYDLVVDGSDNFPTRYLVNDACVLLGKPDVYGAVYRFDGQASIFAAPGGPCYRCLFPDPPPPGAVPGCAEAGVLGVLPGLVGLIQATEAIKLILGQGDPLVGRLLLVEALTMRFHELRLQRAPDCPVCGDRPSIREPIDYEAFCGLPRAGQAPARLEDEIEPAELAERLRRQPPPLLLDVREPHEFAINRIPGARLLPLGQLAEQQAELEREAEIVVVCLVGQRSAEACRLLRAAGFERVRNLRGGMRAWVEQVDPDQPQY